MGAAPSREILQRGLFVVRPPTGGGLGGNKKQDIVLIPLTKEYFPSPDCPLFEQFHRTRCDAGVNYYFRRPGNPGDLSRIPLTDDNDDNLSYPSRETLYRGVVERVEEMLFDTNEEMCQAYERSLEVTSKENGGTKKRVFPILCAVAFRYDAVRLSQHCGPMCSNSSHSQCIMEYGVALCDSIVNIVGCFGFVPMEVEGLNMFSSNFNSANSGCQTHPSAQASSCRSMHDGMFPSGSRNRAPSSHSESFSMGIRERHEDPAAALPGNYQLMAASLTSTLGSSIASPPSYDPHRNTQQRQSRPPAPANGDSTLLKSIGGVNYDHFVSLPPPVAAPLAAIVFLTKSAGEQNLSRVTFVAACMYYNQLVDAGLLQRPEAQTASLPSSTKPYLPPMDTFSFSSLMTNVPILSFVHEMRCRWEHFGPSSFLNGTPLPNGSTLDNPFSNSSATNSEKLTPTGIEMWITDDNMFHGRIGKEVAERLCFFLAEHPARVLQRVELPQTDNKLWRFRGLVDRNSPPPLPSSEGGETPVDDLDVYVMGAAVMDGFDEGDVLRFDKEHHVWVADRTIPLDTVVLTAMRPLCRTARQAPPDDPGWVTMEIEEEDFGCNSRNKKGHGADMGCLRGTRKRTVHVCKGNFYIYRFELNGKTYYHGTVPDFANPNKRAAPLIQSFYKEKHNGESVSANSLNSNGTSVKEKDLITRVKNKRGPAWGGNDLPSITTALFSLASDSVDNGNQVGGTTYLPTRVTSTTIGTAKRWMETLYNYAMGISSPANSGVPATPASLPLSPHLGSPGVSTPITRRQSIFVQVGQGAEQLVEPEETTREKRGFVKRFVHDAQYVWDWKRS